MPISCLICDVSPSNTCSICCNFRFVIVREFIHTAIKQELKLLLIGIIIFEVEFHLFIGDLNELDGQLSWQITC